MANINADVLRVQGDTPAGVLGTIRQLQMGLSKGTDGTDCVLVAKTGSGAARYVKSATTYTCASQAAMTALAALHGDICIRTDESKTYILKTDDPSVFGNWAEILAPDNTTPITIPDGQVAYGNATSDGLTSSSAVTIASGEMTLTSVLNANSVQYDANISTPAYSEGLTFYDADNKGLAYHTNVEGVTCQIGQEMYYGGRVKNTTGSSILNGRAVVRNGVTGNNPLVEYASASSAASAYKWKAIGIATADMAHNAFGYVTTHGLVRDVDTSSWAQDAALYVSTAGDGTLTTTAPTYPNKAIRVGTVNKVHATQGEIFVHVDPNMADTSWMNALQTEDLYVGGLSVKGGAVLGRTGFETSTKYTILSYDSATRKVTYIVPPGEKVFYDGETIETDTHTSVAHPSGYGTYYYYYGASGYTWSTDPWSFSDVQIALVHYYAGYKFAVRECHGSTMSPDSHAEFHRTIGTYLASGGALSGYVLSSTSVWDRRPDVDNATIYDEDLQSYIGAVYQGTGAYKRMYIGPSSVATFADADDIVPLSGNIPQWNNVTNGSLNNLTANQYMNVWKLDIPVAEGSEAFRTLWITGQAAHSTEASANAETTASVSLGSLAGSNAEYVFTARICIRYTAGNWHIVSVNAITGTRVAQTQAPYVSVAWSAVTGTPTTLSGYGITDAASSTHTHAFTSLTGGTAGRIPYATDATSFTDSSELTFANGKLNIDSTASGALTTTRTTSSAATNSIVLRKRNTGTTQVDSGHLLSSVVISGYDGAADVSCASMRAEVASAVTASSGIVPANIIFATMPSSGTLTDRLTLTSDGAIKPTKLSTTPASPASGTGQYYMKGSLFVLQYNDGGTTRYKYLDLSGTGVTWVHTTSAP